MLASNYAQLALTLSQELKSTLYSAMAHITASRVNHFTHNFTPALSHADTALAEAESAGLMELSVKAHMARALALEGVNQQNALSLLQSTLQKAAQHSLVVEANKIGLELDRLNNDVESARTRMQWFEERGLLNGVNIAKCYFPELADKKILVAPVETNVRLEVLGSLQARSDKLTSLRGRKRQELLVFLLEARISGRSEVSRLTLFDTLYLDEDELKASAGLKNLVHSLRETVGDNAVTTTNNGYALGECSSDAELFLPQTRFRAVRCLL